MLQFGNSLPREASGSIVCQCYLTLIVLSHDGDRHGIDECLQVVDLLLRPDSDGIQLQDGALDRLTQTRKPIARRTLQVTGCESVDEALQHPITAGDMACEVCEQQRRETG